ncbi:MAG: sulfatase [Phycisphaerae bacterium]
MKRRDFLKTVAAAASAVAGRSWLGAADPPGGRRPNFVIIFTDDQGYQDVGCFGSEAIRTPRLDRMAAEGRKLTSFYTQPICGPARAAIMTGCYPLRVAERGNVKNTHPVLHEKEITVAEVLKTRGYATAMIGKWDLARHTQTNFHQDLMPNGQGFDFFFGTPTSNDSVVNLYRNSELIGKKTDMATLTRRYTDEAIGFIRGNKDRPFLVYLAHTMPHTRLAASEQFLGKSKRGLYGDVIEEIDWNVGRVLDAVKECGLEKATYVIFTSDNGPWLIKKAHGGSPGPLRSGKASTWEGGQRVPCIVWAPGRVPAGTACDEIASTLDVLPTLAKLAGAEAPSDRVIDGHDISDLIHGRRGATSPTEAYYYYLYTHLQAVRSGKWKLHLPRPEYPPWCRGLHGRHIDRKDVFEIKEPLLYDLAADVGETTNVADKHPDVVSRLLKLTEKAREDIGDYDRIGKGARFFDDGPKRPDMNRWKTAGPQSKTKRKPQAGRQRPKGK